MSCPLLPWQRGTYLPQTYIIQEEMVVTEYVSDKESLGSFIYHLCNGKDTYRLRRRGTPRRECQQIPLIVPSPTLNVPLPLSSEEHTGQLVLTEQLLSAQHC